MTCEKQQSTTDIFQHHKLSKEYTGWYTPNKVSFVQELQFFP